MTAQKRVLAALQGNIGQVVTHARLTAAMGGGDGGSNRLESLISKLRAKGHDIRSVRGRGYMLHSSDWRVKLAEAMEAAAQQGFVPRGCWFQMRFMTRVPEDRKTLQQASVAPGANLVAVNASWPADPSV